AGADDGARRAARAALPASRPGEPLRLLRLRVVAAAGSARVDGAVAVDGGPGTGAARGLPGTAADPRAVGATTTAAWTGGAAGSGPDERAGGAAGKEGLRATRAARHGAHPARNAAHRPEGLA